MANRNRKNILSLNPVVQQSVAPQTVNPNKLGNHHAPAMQTNHDEMNAMEGTQKKTFVSAMKKLFDIMDDQRTGYVKFTEIENRWQDDGATPGVIESLRKVTPSNGLLSFERFCAGLKICLLRNQNDTLKNRQAPVDNNQEIPMKPRPPSAPVHLDLDNGSSKAQWNVNNTATVRPNNAMPAQRTLSMPQLNPGEGEEMMVDAPIIMQGPPKPPRVSLNIERSSNGNSNMNNNNIDRLDKAEIRNALQNWQMGLLMNEADTKEGNKKLQDYQNFHNRIMRTNGDGQIDFSLQGNGVYQKKTNIRRREPRRHTLQNGIDYNMLKRLKQIEQEKEVLVQGLGAVEKAREWYLKQLAIVQDKIKYLGRVGAPMEQWSEAHQERLDLQRARVLEVNRHLTTLAESWERGGFPMHMNLALRHQPSMQQYQYPNDVINRLKQQNHQLSEDAAQKNEKVSILEREKASLIREVLQLQRARANGSTAGSDDMVF